MACAIALKWMLNKRIANTSAPTTSQVLKFETAHRATVREACNFCMAMQDAYGNYLHPGLVAGVVLIRYMSKLKLEEPFLAFLDEVYSGRAKEVNTPGFVLRKLIERHLAAKTIKAGKMTQESLIGSTLKAYKLVEQGKEARLDSDVLFPSRKNEKFSVCL